MRRSSGVLMHISSLPSPYGVGTMGKEAREFVDFLVKSGQTYWQILPVCPTSYGDSPYASYSTFAGNPYFIDLEYLCKEKLLKKSECEEFYWGDNEKYIDYGVMYISRYALLHKAYDRFVNNTPEDFDKFCKDEAEWLDEFALFMALKDANEGQSWFNWDTKLKLRDAKAIEEAKEEVAAEPAVSATDSLAAALKGETVNNEAVLAQMKKEHPLASVLQFGGYGAVVGIANHRDTAEVNKLLAMKESQAILPRDLSLKWGVKGEDYFGGRYDVEIFGRAVVLLEQLQDTLLVAKENNAALLANLVVNVTAMALFNRRGEYRRAVRKEKNERQNKKKNEELP